MDVTISEETIAKAVAEVVRKGIEDGVGSWETRNALQASISEAVTEANLPAMLKAHLDVALAENAEQVVAEVLAEALPGIKAGMTMVISGAMQAMVYGLLTGKPSPYSSDDVRVWNEAGALIANTDNADLEPSEVQPEAVPAG